MSDPEPRHPLCEHFLGWQCRIRQLAVRQGGGQPTTGMRPGVRLSDGTGLDAMNVLILKHEAAEHTARFRHIVRRTHDPAERHAEAQKELAATYYQRPHEFSDVMTALFALDSRFAAHLSSLGTCEMRFDQYNQRYALPCGVVALTEADSAYQATYWHNAMFNPALPGRVAVVALTPDWARATAEPPAPGSGQ